MAKKLNKLFRKPVQDMAAYSLKHYRGVIKLDQNELPWNLPDTLRSKWQQKLKQIELNRYPEVQAWDLVNALAKKFRLKKTQVLAGHGSNVLIQAITLATAVGDTVMAPEPSFALYHLNAEALGNRFVPMKLAAKDFSWDIKKILQDIRKHQPKVIFIPNPNAPTGNLFPRKDLEKILKVAKGLVVVDEAYRQFSQESLVAWLKQYDHLALLHTFSKGFGLGGARVGYLLANEEVVAQVSKVLVPYGVTRMAEAVALLALKEDKIIQNEIAKVLKERERVFEAMNELSTLKVYPSSGNFLLFRVDDGKKCFRHLLRHKVLVRDQSSYPRLQGCLRVTIGTPRENTAFLKAIQAYRA